jgi:hypothetical protein
VLATSAIGWAVKGLGIFIQGSDPTRSVLEPTVSYVVGFCSSLSMQVPGCA